MLRFLLFPVLILIFFSCGVNKKQVASIPLAPEILTGKTTQWMVSKDRQDSTESFIDYAFYTNPHNEWQKSVNDFIGAATYINTQFEGEAEYANEPLTHAFFYQRLNQMILSFKSSELDQGGFMYVEQHNSISNELMDFCQVELSASYYFGGAHPNSWVNWATFSKETGERVGLSHFFPDLTALNVLAEKHFRKAVNLVKNEDLTVEGYWFENGIFTCPENFKITEAGLSFIFNAYEVAPYVMGSIDFFIPMNELKSILPVPLEFAKK